MTTDQELELLRIEIENLRRERNDLQEIARLKRERLSERLGHLKDQASARVPIISSVAGAVAEEAKRPHPTLSSIATKLGRGALVLGSAMVEANKEDESRMKKRKRFRQKG